MEELKTIRDQWNGYLIIKGIMTKHDADLAYQLGADGIVVSNHGGRQSDVIDSPLLSLPSIVKNYGTKMTVMMDSGIRNGTDLSIVLALGAKCGFLGRAFMYSVAALGNKGGDHLAEILQQQITQTMQQLRCQRVSNLPDFLSSNS